MARLVDRGIRALAQSADGHSGRLIADVLDTDPDWTMLRRDSRFKPIIARVRGLPAKKGVRLRQNRQRAGIAAAAFLARDLRCRGNDLAPRNLRRSTSARQEIDIDYRYAKRIKGRE
jgi:hypothetical protein